MVKKIRRIVRGKVTPQGYVVVKYTYATDVVPSKLEQILDNRMRTERKQDMRGVDLVPVSYLKEIVGYNLTYTIKYIRHEVRG